MFGAESGSTEVYLNLTPLMDVMSNILFFLLAAFGTSIVAILPATMPVASSEQTDVEKDTDKVTVAVRLTDKGLNINCQNDFMTPNELKPYEAFIVVRNHAEPSAGARANKDPCSGPEANRDPLCDFTAALRRVKDHFPASKTMVLAPDDTIGYQEVIRVMDAAREQRISESRKVILFPDVVLSGVIGAEPETPKGGRK